MKPQKRVRNGKVRWVGRYVGSDGLERSKTFDREKDAKAWCAERERELRRGEWIDPASQETTVGELWAAWDRLAKSEGTAAIRARVGRNLGRLERTPIGKVRASDVRDWHHALRNGRPWVKGCEGLAETTVASFAGQLSGCMSMAVADGLILKSPCAKLSAGRGDSVHVVTPDEVATAEQVLAMAEAAREGRRKSAKGGPIPQHPTFARMIVVGAATGLRAGEISGLRIRSVDFLRRELVVSEQSTLTSEFGWRRLKTPASRRVIPLPKVAVDALAEELAANPCDDRSMPVFRTSRGTMWNSSAIATAFRSARDRCGLGKQVTWHSLRHFYASTLIFSGASVKTVQARLGHSSAATTLEIYTHLWPGEDERTRAAVDAVLGGDGSGSRDQAGTGPSDGESAGGANHA